MDMDKIDATIEHDGDPPFVWVAVIKRDFKDNCHIFTSDEIPGLLVASQSLEIAVKQLPSVIEELVRRNLGFKCNVSLGGKNVPGKKIEQPDYAVVTKLAA